MKKKILYLFFQIECFNFTFKVTKCQKNAQKTQNFYFKNT